MGSALHWLWASLERQPGGCPRAGAGFPAAPWAVQSSLLLQVILLPLELSSSFKLLPGALGDELLLHTYFI